MWSGSPAPTSVRKTRIEKSATYTREKYNNFHGRTLYGTSVNGKILGEHTDAEEKPVLKPETPSRKRKFV